MYPIRIKPIYLLFLNIHKEKNPSLLFRAKKTAAATLLLLYQNEMSYLSMYIINVNIFTEPIELEIFPIE